MVEGMKIVSWRQDDRQAKLTLEFGIWNSKVSIQAYESGNFRNKKFSRNLNDCELKLVEKVIAKVMTGSPETKCSCQFQKYDRDSKQYRTEAVISLEKDSKQVYKISLTDVTKQSTVTFVVKAPATMTMGTDNLSDANLSALKMETLKDWIINARIWAPMTYQPPRDGQGGGNRGGYGGGQRSQGGGGYSAPSEPSLSSDPEDLPF